MIVQLVNLKTQFACYYSEVGCTISQHDYNKISYKSRERARIDNLRRLLDNILKVLANQGMMSRVFKRVKLIFKNKRKYQDDTRSVYQGSIH